MATLALVFGVILLAMAGLALGVLAGRAPPRGSCGGLGCASCAACPRRRNQQRDRA